MPNGSGSSSVTTVVMTRNRRSDLLANLPRLEGAVVVVDNGSTDGTVAALEGLGHPALQVIALPRNEGAVARNVGVRAARTPLVAFADDDSWWAPGALSRAAEQFERHPRLAVLAARILLGGQERLDPVCELMAAAPLGRPEDLPGAEVLGFVACAAIVRRVAFLEAGGFDPVVFFPGEEERLALDLAARGWALAYVPDVVAHHHPSDEREASASRAAVITRNHLLTALMRRPWPVVARRAAAAARGGPAGRRGLARALPRARAALAARRVVPPGVERRARLLEASHP